MKRTSSVRALVKNIATSASNLKAIDIKILDLRPFSAFTDFFVICSGSSTRHVQSVADRVRNDQEKKGIAVFGAEGYQGGEWVLLDYGAVVVHVFLPTARLFYNIERFWGDAPRITFKGI